MTQADLNFSGYPENPFSKGTQNHRLWEYLKMHRKITTKELHHHLQMDCARVRDMRKRGLLVECTSIPGDPSNRVYQVIS